MCGEDPPARPDVSVLVETPPRVWGRQGIGKGFADSHRNTPTCVGKTQSSIRVSRERKKHPHVCGEDRVWQP